MGRYAVASEHYAFFHRNGYVEFEDLLEKQECDALLLAAEQVVATRVGCSVDALFDQPHELLLRQGRDVWRASDEVRRIVCSQRLAEVAAQLTRLPLLRIGFDQLLHPGRYLPGRPLPIPMFTLEEMSSYQGLVCGFLLKLASRGDGSYELSAQKPGNAVFISTEYPIDLSGLYEESAARYLLVTYANKTSQYRKNPADWAGHTIRDLGYAYGDRLSDVHHPYVWHPSR